MTEPLSEQRVKEIEDWHRYSDTGPSRTVRELIASHRLLHQRVTALEQERDELRSLNEHHKEQFLKVNLQLSEMRKR